MRGAFQNFSGQAILFGSIGKNFNNGSVSGTIESRKNVVLEILDEKGEGKC